jgi:heparin/heparan-sulfate lyase
VFRNLANTYLYKVLPDGTTSREDDNEYPHLHANDYTVLAYAVSRFKDPYAAWMLRESGWLPPAWPLPVLDFLWNDPQVVPRDPAAALPSELPRHYFFGGVNHLVARGGWSPGSTWLEFSCGPYFAKHDHLDQNHFTIYRKGYLAIDSGADYTSTESPHYLNYYRRTVAHNTLLVYKPGEEFFWADNRWKAANDGGQRMDSSRFWNSIRSPEDWRRTRDLWEVGRMEAVDALPGRYVYARGDASRAYHPSKLERFIRHFCYLPEEDRIVVYDQVTAADPRYKKVWLLHGVNQPSVNAHGEPAGQGGTRFRNAGSFSFSEQQGVVFVHALLPSLREVIGRGGPGWEFWTPGDAAGGEYGSGQNWPMIPPEGGPLPEDPYLKAMWKTFWGENFTRIARSNTRAVVPGAWRVEVSPATPAREDDFLHVLELGDAGSFRPTDVRLAEGQNLKGALIAGGTAVLFAFGAPEPRAGEISIPDIRLRNLLLLGLRPDTSYEIQAADAGVPRASWRVSSNASGVVLLAEPVPGNVRLRLVPFR